MNTREGNIEMEKIKAAFIAAFGVLFSWLGILAIPVLLLVGMNITDYVTGLYAAKYREQKVTSYRSIRGIYKKVFMWVLIIIGWVMDILINYTVQYMGLGIKIPFVVATVVTVWLICNEVISTLENLVDIGVDIPPFLMPIVKLIKGQVEDKSKIN